MRTPSLIRRRRKRRVRPLLAAIVLAVALLLLAYPLASASDVFSNVAPASQLPAGSLTNAYPLGNYALDHHFDAVSASLTGGVDASGVAPTIAWFLAQAVWSLTAFLADAVITLFTFAFSLDLIGSGSPGDGGALAPVSVAVRSIYRDTFGAPWLVVAILLTGLWAMWHALVRRRYTETAGALGVSLLFVVIALAFVTRPEIIAGASRLTNQMSGAFLALSTDGNLNNQAQAKQADADQLFTRLIYEPWVVLNFGGLEHCVTGSGKDQLSVPVRPLSRDPGRDAALSRRLATGTQVQADGKLCVNDRVKYAARFLRWPPDSPMRDGEYEAIKAGDTGKLFPFGPSPADAGYKLGEADKPAAEAMGKGGQYQRLLLAVVIFAGELGAFLLLGAVAVVVVVAQVLVLLLLAFAPVALVAGVVPGRGHDFFKGWLTRLASCLLRKAVYSLVLAVLLTVNAALADATSNLGWLLAFGLQAVFFWTVFLSRRQLVGQLSHSLTGHGRVEPDGLGRAAIVSYATARLTLGHLRRRSGGDHAGSRGGDRPGDTRPDPDAPPAGGPDHGGPSAPPPEPSDPATPPPDRGGPAAPPPEPGDSSAPPPEPGDPAPAGPRSRDSAPSPAGGEEDDPRPARPVSSAAGPARAADPVRSETSAPAHEHDAPREPVRGAVSAGATDAEESGRDHRQASTGTPASEEPGRRTAGAARESALRRGLREDARRIRRETRHLREEGQQLAEEGRRLRQGTARQGHKRAVPAAKPGEDVWQEPPAGPAGPGPAPLDGGTEEARP